MSVRVSIAPPPSSAPPPVAQRDASPGGAPTLKQIAESNALLKQAEDETDELKKRELLQKALVVNPRNIDALDELAGKMLDDERWKDARDLARRCLAIDARRDSCGRTLRWSLTRTGDFDAAAHEYADCLEGKPPAPGCLSFWTGDALRKGDIPRARSLLGRLEALDPDGVDAIVLEASLALHTGDRARALSIYETACTKGQEFACNQAHKLSTDAGAAR